MTPIRKFSLLLVAAQMVLQPLTLNAETHYVENSKNNSHFSFKPPIIEELEKGNGIPLNLGLAANDPSLDQDPFFLNSQIWQNGANSKTSEVEVSTAGDALVISVPEAQATLKIDQDLQLLTMSDEYIFLSAKSTFTGFEKKSVDLATPAEGIFIIVRNDLLNFSTDRLPVPVFFLPLPDNGWKNASGTYLVKSDSLLVLDDNDETLPIPASLIKDVLKAENFNLFLAQSFTFNMNPSNNNLRSVLPAAGVTAGFGILFTGINLENVSQSFFEVAAGNSLKDRTSALLVAAKNYFQIPNAEASGFVLDPKLTKRLVRIGIVVVVALTASVVLRLTYYRKYFKQKHGSSANLKPLERAKHFTTDVGDVFAHTLTTFSQLSEVWFANTVEFLGDRYFPELASANNTMVRKFLNKTVYWVRGTNERTPVSGKTWLFGSVILGGIDTLFVAVQLYGVVPWIGQGIGEHIPALKSRVDDAFEVGNPNIASINQNETIRNAAAYLTVGASSFSQDLQSQLYEKIENDIKDEMKREGLNPESSANLADFKMRVDRRLNFEMQKMGVPNKDDFLFDANYIYSNSLNALGYQLPPSNSQIQNEKGKFVGLNRPGLIISAASASISKLKSDSASSPLGLNSPYREEAIHFLSTYYKDLNVLASFIKAPLQVLLNFKKRDSEDIDGISSCFNKIKQTRQAFTLLTYEGDFDNIRSLLPTEWQSYNLEAVRLAAKTFSSTFYNYINGEKIEKNFEPAKKDSLSKQQEKKALRKAMESFRSKTGYAFNLSLATKTDTNFFKSEYVASLNSILGLYPDYLDQPELELTVASKASDLTNDELNKSDVRKYLLNLGQEARFQFEAGVQAASFVKAYKEVILTGSSVSSISPSQPGRFQKFRQYESVRNSVVLTRIARAAESVMAGDQLELGRSASLSRNIPGWYDFKMSNKRVFARAITRATATYWFNYYIWGINLPAHLWALSLVTGWTVGAPSQMLNRFFNYQGLKPMGDIKMMGLFAVIYTWATFSGMIPQQIFAGDFQKLFEFVVHNHLPESLLISSTIIAALHYKEPVREKAKSTFNDIKYGAKQFAISCSGIFRANN
jgi:hypothetical protein